MNSNCDIIIFSLSRWDAPISSPAFSLAKEFAKHNRVFYIDHPVTLKEFMYQFKTPKIQSRKDALLWGKDIYHQEESFPENLTMVTPGMAMSVNFLPEGFIYSLLSKKNDTIIFNTIRHIIEDYKVDEFIFFNAFDPYFCRDFPGDIKPSLKIYLSMDDMSQAHYTSRHGPRLEEEIIRKYDLTFTTSQELRRLKSAYSDHVYFLPNAADFSIFQKALTEKYPMPPELQSANGRKIVGFTGNIEARMDYELLKEVITYHRDKVIALVGPVTTDEHKTIGLTAFPNVIMVGQKKITELPQYLQYFDCALIPFKKNTLTRSIYPLKINEYLAAGRPVVATDFSEDIKSFRDIISIGEHYDAFVEAIDFEILDNSAEKIIARTRVANQNTWSARVASFWEIVEEFIHASQVSSTAIS